MKKLLISLLGFSVSLFSKEAWEGNHYQATSRPQFEMAEFALSKLPKDHYASILDVGCGSGDFTVELRNNADYVLGVDFSESMIAKAHELYGDRDNVVFKVGDIRALDSIQKTFDLITAFHPIQWIPSADQSKAFESMANRLNPGGTCLVLVSDRFNIFYKPLLKIASQPKWQHYMPEKLEPWNWQTVTSISNSFERVNLRPLNVCVWYKKYRLETKQAFFDFTANWFYGAAHFNYIPEEKQEELFNEVLEEFLTSLSYSGTGPIEFECPFVIGIAQK